MKFQISACAFPHNFKPNLWNWWTPPKFDLPSAMMTRRWSIHFIWTLPSRIKSLQQRALVWNFALANPSRPSTSLIQSRGAWTVVGVGWRVGRRPSNQPTAHAPCDPRKVSRSLCERNNIMHPSSSLLRPGQTERALKAHSERATQRSDRSLRHGNESTRYI